MIIDREYINFFDQFPVDHEPHVKLTFQDEIYNGVENHPGGRRGQGPTTFTRMWTSVFGGSDCFLGPQEVSLCEMRVLRGVIYVKKRFKRHGSGVPIQ